MTIISYQNYKPREEVKTVLFGEKTCDFSTDPQKIVEHDVNLIMILK